jgi:tRNA (guanine37-N1)-methyltransferase
MTTKKITAVCVPFKEAESVRRVLRERNLLRNDVEIQKNGKCVYFPVEDVPKELCSNRVVTKSFKLKTVKPHCYKDILKFPKKFIDELPTSYDVVGAIILIKLSKTLFPYRKEIGKALLKTHKNIRTVCLINPVSGELRTRDVTVIAGDNQTLTTHTEYGLSFDVNVETTYFSPRLASERRRVANLVNQGEIIVDMFAGVAPFSIMIARYAKPKVVYAIDKNQEAIRLAQQNAKQNHVLDTVEVIHSDANNIDNVIAKKADRIIMNLPFSAYRFFPSALSIATQTCNIHYYDIIKEEDIEARINALKKIAIEHTFFISDMVIRKIKTYAPREFYIGIDITATKNADVA